jgi:hypothetical protein
MQLRLWRNDDWIQLPPGGMTRTCAQQSCICSATPCRFVGSLASVPAHEMLKNYVPRLGVTGYGAKTGNDNRSHDKALQLSEVADGTSLARRGVGRSSRASSQGPATDAARSS